MTAPFTPPDLAADRRAWALRVATDPAFAPFPEERAKAWAVLKQARGQTHCIWRLRPAAMHRPGTLADTLDTINRRGLGRRIRAHAARIAGPEPDGAA